MESNFYLSGAKNGIFRDNYVRTVDVLAPSVAMLSAVTISTVYDKRTVVAVSIKRCRLTNIGISMLKIRRSRDRLIFNMEIPYLGKTVFILKTGPWIHEESVNCMRRRSVEKWEKSQSILMLQEYYSAHKGMIYFFWLNDMMTSSNGNIFRVTGPLCGELTGEFRSQRPVTQSFDVFFDLRLNTRLSKQSWGSWFETPSRPLWRQCKDLTAVGHMLTQTTTQITIPI